MYQNLLKTTIKGNQMVANKIIIDFFKQVLEDGQIDDKTISHFVSPNYIQQVDGKTLNFEDFKKHLKKQREIISRIQITFIQIVSSGDIVFTNHEVSVHKKDGNLLHFKVIAQFTLQDNRVIACDELTRLIDGNEGDSNLGSRY